MLYLIGTSERGPYRVCMVPCRQSLLSDFVQKTFQVLLSSCLQNEHAHARWMGSTRAILNAHAPRSLYLDRLCEETRNAVVIKRSGEIIKVNKRLNCNVG
jgi:hypothetical protein